MHYLYITNNHAGIKELAKSYANLHNMSFFSCENNKENMEHIKTIFDTLDNVVIFLHGLNKSPVSDSLLKLLEDNKKNIVMFATTETYDVKDALMARFIVQYFDNIDIEKAVDEFIKTNNATKEVYSSLAFYISLARKNINNITLINNIIGDIRRCTYNIPWDYYYYKLRKEWK